MRRIGPAPVVTHDAGITHVLTNDHHFRQEGFTVVSE